MSVAPAAGVTQPSPRPSRATAAGRHRGQCSDPTGCFAVHSTTICKAALRNDRTWCKSEICAEFGRLCAGAHARTRVVGSRRPGRPPSWVLALRRERRWGEGSSDVPGLQAVPDLLRSPLSISYPSGSLSSQHSNFQPSFFSFSCGPKYV